MHFKTFCFNFCRHMRNLWKNSAWLTFFILQKEMSTNFSNTIAFDRQPACLFLSKAYLIVFKSFFIHMSTQAFVSLLRVLDQPKKKQKIGGQQTRSFFLILTFRVVYANVNTDLLVGTTIMSSRLQLHHYFI